MANFLLNRAVQAVVAIFGVMSLVFVIMRLSGDPTLLLVPDGTPREQIEVFRHQLGFDRPMIAQYAAYLRQVARFDLGVSFVQRIPVLDIVLSRVPYTLALAGGALLVAVGIGLPVGVLTGFSRGSVLDRSLLPVVLAAQSMPTFWSGILLILVFAVRLNWLPSSGAEGPGAIVMPSVALGALSMATFARIARTSILDELDKDYVRVALAKGISLRRVHLRHVLRNAAVPIISIAALEIANLLAGAVIVETVFAWPGLGQLAVQSIVGRDFLVVQALVLLASFTYVLLNFAADLLYSVVDPRITLRRGSP